MLVPGKCRARAPCVIPGRTSRELVTMRLMAQGTRLRLRYDTYCDNQTSVETG